ncbi:TIGR02530 family flagellar biosynthesis protein [Paenibacillus marinisediminis]
MTPNFNIRGIGPTAPIQPSGRTHGAEAASRSNTSQQASFKRMFEQELKRSEDLQFSHHATQRMMERGMNMTPELMSKMNDAISQAASKGSKQSLLLVQDAAYIVNVPSRTVITALDDPFKQGHVFTAIDSAICIE